MILRKSLIAKQPETKAVIVPKARGKMSFVGKVNSPLKRSMLSRISEPTMMGIDIKKEKSADCFLSTPDSRRAVMVAPLLDMPGKTAIP